MVAGTAASGLALHTKEAQISEAACCRQNQALRNSVSLGDHCCCQALWCATVCLACIAALFGLGGWCLMTWWSYDVAAVMMKNMMEV